MSQTVRQMIIDILLEGPATAKELSARVSIPEKEVFPHLAHIRKNLHHGQQRLVMEPACCRACGFVFQKRERFSKPGHCPACVQPKYPCDCVVAVLPQFSKPLRRSGNDSCLCPAAHNADYVQCQIM